MAAYLIVDVDDLLHFSADKGIDLHELAIALLGSARFAAGLYDTAALKAVAVADWRSQLRDENLQLEPEAIFRSAGYRVLDVQDRSCLPDCLLQEVFYVDAFPVDELILATTGRDLLTVIERVKVSDNTRIRVWGDSEDALRAAGLPRDIIFQPLVGLHGIKGKNVWVYIDFENISISLNEQGFVVNLDHLIERLVSQAQAHGKLVKMAAYAPWGQRGALPPLVDSSGREVADDAPARLMMANIDPVFHLPGKQSADIRIARDVLTDVGHPEAGDVIILATGDRDFNDVINPLLQRNKTVVVWGVRGSTGRLLQINPSLQLEYIDDFTDLQTHQSLSTVETEVDTESFIPSQWSSVIVQFFRLETANPGKDITSETLIGQLIDVGDVISPERGNDLVSQAISLGILRQQSALGVIELNLQHPIVDKTLLIVNRMIRRVANTLVSRNWEYVNYGFLLKGLSMERDLDRPGMNESDQWRSHWIDCLVRERILQRDLVPHRHNPDDLVPVIRLPEARSHPLMKSVEEQTAALDFSSQEWEGVPLHRLYETEPEVARMVNRIVVSVQQFTSFRNFAWCPLGSLHRRLREFDSGVIFQHAVEYLLINKMVTVNEYPNPRSDFNTKGIELDEASAYVAVILAERDEFVRVLLEMYRSNVTISRANLEQRLTDRWDVPLWVSIMKIENVLNPLPGRADQYSLFRTHHTVKIVANDDVDEVAAAKG
ncbi:MAG: NYN domain-containing protein [Chloroflexota bacterium]|nr:NYN domain-containing protein [Chloroflexota bacterium]